MNGPDIVSTVPDAGGDRFIEKRDFSVAGWLLEDAKISTTQRYRHLDDRELANAQDLIDRRAFGYVLFNLTTLARSAGETVSLQ